MGSQKYEVGGQILEFSEATGRLVPVNSIGAPLRKPLARKPPPKSLPKKKPVPLKGPAKVAAAKRVLTPKGVAGATALLNAARKGNPQAVKKIAALKKVAMGPALIPAALAKSALAVMQSQIKPPPASPTIQNVAQSEAIERGEQPAFIPISDAAPNTQERADMAQTEDLITQEEAQDSAEEIEEIEEELPPMSEEDESMDDATVGMVLGTSLGISFGSIKRGIKRGVKAVGKGVKKVGKVAVKYNPVVLATQLAASVAATPIRLAFRAKIARPRAAALARSRGHASPTRQDKHEAVQWGFNKIKAKFPAKLGAVTVLILKNTKGVSLSGPMTQAVLGAVDPATITAVSAAITTALTKMAMGLVFKEGVSEPPVAEEAAEDEGYEYSE